MSTVAAAGHQGPRLDLRRIASGAPLVIIAILLLSTAGDILPGDAIVKFGQVQLTAARLLILAGLMLVVVSEGPRRELFRAGIALPATLLLVVSVIASHKFGTYPRFRFLVEGIALFYLTFAVMRARADAGEALATVGLIAVGVVAVTAVAQVSQGVPTGFYRHGCVPVTKAFGPVPSGAIIRAIGPFFNPNVLAGYLLLLVPLGGLAATALGRVRGVWPAAVTTLGLGYLAVVFTYSRAAVLLSLGVIGVGIALSRVAHRRWLIAVALGFAIAISFLVSSCGSDATAGFGRLEEWRQTLSVIRHNPVWGVGLGNLGTVLHARNAASHAQHAHNLFLTWWAEAGTGALIAWIWIAAMLIWRSLRGALEGSPTARAALLAMLGFFGYSMTDHPANVAQVALAFWVLAGIAAASYIPVRATGRRFGSGRRGAEEDDDDERIFEAPRTGNVRVRRRDRADTGGHAAPVEQPPEPRTRRVPRPSGPSRFDF